MVVCFAAKSEILGLIPSYELVIFSSLCSFIVIFISYELAFTIKQSEVKYETALINIHY